MSHSRRTAASLAFALLLALLLPGGAQALPAPLPVSNTADAEPAGILGALTLAWDWLLSLPELPLDLDGLLPDLKLPGCYEGSHLDPNGGRR